MAGNPSRETTAQAVEIKRGDRIHQGSFTVADDTVTVAYLDQTRKAALRGVAPEALARELLTEMVRAAERRR